MISPQHKINLKTLISEKTKESLEQLIQFGITKKIAKGTFIIKEGENCELIFLVLDGIFRTFRMLNHDEEEYTTGFSFKGDIDTSPFAFFFETTSTETIEAITDANVIIIYKDKYLKVIQENNKIQGAIILLLAAYIETLENRLHQKRTLTAEDIYHYLVQNQGEEINKIPLKYIASYLGITKERLSRIRNKIK